MNHRYEIYQRINFAACIGYNADCYDRYLQRIYEMTESVRICKHTINLIPSGEIKSDNNAKVISSSSLVKSTMESLINHFKECTEGETTRKHTFYIQVEAPKGHMGLFVISNALNHAYRIKIKAPGFFHLQSIKTMAKFHHLADVVTIIGTQDIVFGEVDR